jgi:hypothetical protein
VQGVSVRIGQSPRRTATDLRGRAASRRTAG